MPIKIQDDVLTGKLLTENFFSHSADAHMPILNQVKLNLITRAAIKSLQSLSQKIADIEEIKLGIEEQDEALEQQQEQPLAAETEEMEEEENSRDADIKSLLNKYATELGIEVVPVKSNHIPHFDESSEESFQKLLTQEITTENVIEELYEEFKSELITALNIANTPAVRHEKIQQILDPYGKDEKFDPDFPIEFIDEHIHITLMNRLASSTNPLINLNDAQKIEIENGATVYTFNDCSIAKAFVIDKDGARHPLTEFVNKASPNEIALGKIIKTSAQLIDLLRAAPEVGRTNILKFFPDTELEQIISTESEKIAILETIPRTQREALSPIFKKILPGNLKFDPILKDGFFKPGVLKKIEYDIPLPKNPESLREFIASEEGKVYQAKFTDLLNGLRTWAQTNNVPLTNLTVLEKKMKEYEGLDATENKKRFALYNQGPILLKGILDILNTKANKNEVERHKSIFNDLLKSFIVCEPGIFTNITIAYGKLVNDKAGILAEMRRQIASQVAVDNLKETGLIDEHNRANEIHYTVALLNFFSYEIGIHKVDDYYAEDLNQARSTDTLKKMAFSHFKQRVEIALSFSNVIEFMRQTSSSEISGILKDIDDSNSTGKMNNVDHVMDAYGVDESFSNNALVGRNWKGDKTIVYSNEVILSEITTSLLTRLISSNLVDESKFPVKQLDENIKLVLPQNDYGLAGFVVPKTEYNLAYIKDKDGKRKGLYSYLEELSRLPDPAEAEAVVKEAVQAAEAAEAKHEAAVSNNEEPATIANLAKEATSLRDEAIYLVAEEQELLREFPAKRFESENNIQKIIQKIFVTIRGNDKFSFHELADLIRQFSEQSQVRILGRELENHKPENTFVLLTQFMEMRKLSAGAAKLYLDKVDPKLVQQLMNNPENLIKVTDCMPKKLHRQLFLMVDIEKFYKDFTKEDITRITVPNIVKFLQRFPLPELTELLFEKIDKDGFKNLMAHPQFFEKFLPIMESIPATTKVIFDVYDFNELVKNPQFRSFNNVIFTMTSLPDKDIPKFIENNKFIFNDLYIEPFFEVSTISQLIKKGKYLPAAAKEYIFSNHPLLAKIVDGTLGKANRLLEIMPADKQKAFIKTFGSSKDYLLKLSSGKDTLKENDMMNLFLLYSKNTMKVNPLLLQWWYKEKDSILASKRQDMSVVFKLIEKLNPEIVQQVHQQRQLDLVESLDTKIKAQISHLTKKGQAKANLQTNVSAKLSILDSTAKALQAYLKAPKEKGNYEKLLLAVMESKAETAKVPHVGTLSKMFKRSSTTTQILDDFIKKATKHADKELMEQAKTYTGPRRA